MHTKILLALALVVAHASAFSLAPSCAAPARQGALALRADAASVPLVGRRTLLAGTAATLPLVFGATPALAKLKPSDGKWAKHEGAFDAAELEGEPHHPRGIFSRHTCGPFHDYAPALPAYNPDYSVIPPPQR